MLHFKRRPPSEQEEKPLRNSRFGIIGFAIAVTALIAMAGFFVTRSDTKMTMPKKPDIQANVASVPANTAKDLTNKVESQVLGNGTATDNPKSTSALSSITPSFEPDIMEAAPICDQAAKTAALKVYETTLQAEEVVHNNAMKKLVKGIMDKIGIGESENHRHEQAVIRLKNELSEALANAGCPL